MYRIVLAATILLGFLFSSTTPLNAGDEVIYGCSSRWIGWLRIVASPSDCRRGEVPIQWNKAGLQGPQGKRGRVGPRGPAGAIKVFDANNQYLGILIYSDPPSYRRSPITAENPELTRIGVFIPGPNVKAYIDQVTGDISKDVDLLFESANCTGNPFIYAPDVLHATSSGAKRKYYIGEGSPQTINPRSLLSHNSSHNTCEGWTVSRTKSKGFLAIEVAPEEIPFSIPVSLPIRYEVVE